MKTPIKLLLSAFVLATLLFTACTQEEMKPEAPESFTFQPGEANPEGGDIDLGKGNTIELAEDLYALSWTIEDDLIIQRTGIESLVATLIVKDQRVQALYFSSETLSYIVTHEDLLLRQGTESNIIVMEDDIMRRNTTEDRKLIPLDEERNIVVIESDVMLNIVIENDIILSEGYVDNVELRYIIAEDEVMLFTFSQGDEDLFTSFLTIRDDIF